MSRLTRPSPVVTALAVVVAPAVLLIAPETSNGLAAAAVTLAIVAVWSVGLGDQWRRDWWVSAALAISVGVGCLLASGAGVLPGSDGAAWFGLPDSLVGLLVGIWIVPLVVTSVGFAITFRAPDAEAMTRLRASRNTNDTNGSETT